jgi:hypothetical protein
MLSKQKANTPPWWSLKIAVFYFGAATGELCICIISLLLAPSTAQHCSVAPGFAA